MQETEINVEEDFDGEISAIVKKETVAEPEATVEEKEETETLLKVENISLSFIQYVSGLKQKELNVISDLSLEARSGEVLAIVGSSGSGKSLLAHAILGILPSNAKFDGKMEYDGQILTQEKKEELRGREIALVPQSTTYLDPLMKISNQVVGDVEEEEKEQMKKLQREIFQTYDLDLDVDKMYPHELSGGMARRVLVSTAIISGAKLIIADEPTPGLDEKTLTETLSYFRDMADSGCAVMLITHDIEAALKISDKIAVFYAGTVLEVANVQDFSNQGGKLRHPYTRALWNALPQNQFQAIEGHQPMQDEISSRCVFYERCNQRSDECTKNMPILKETNGGLVRCNNASSG